MVVVEVSEDRYVEMLIIVTPTTKKNAENWVDLMLFHDECPHKTKVMMFSLITHVQIRHLENRLALVKNELKRKY
jgi:hypothetical protein